MQHEIKPERLLQLLVISLIQGRFDPAQARRRSAQPGVAKPWIIIVQFSTCVRLECHAAEILIQKLFMCHLIDTELPEEPIIQPPADIVMTPEVIQECILPGKGEHRLQLMPEQPHILRRDRMPGGRHRGNVIQDVAFRLVHRAKVWNNL